MRKKKTDVVPNAVADAIIDAPAPALSDDAEPSTRRRGRPRRASSTSVRETLHESAPAPSMRARAFPFVLGVVVGFVALTLLALVSAKLAVKPRADDEDQGEGLRIPADAIDMYTSSGVMPLPALFNTFAQSMQTASKKETAERGELASRVNKLERELHELREGK